MSNGLSAAEIAQITNDLSDLFADTCEILSRTAGSANEYNEYDAATYASGGTIVCGLDMRGGDERQQDNMTVIQYDASVRLPFDTLVAETSRVKVLTRFGATLSAPLIYEVKMLLHRGPGGMRYGLKKVVV